MTQRHPSLRRSVVSVVILVVVLATMTFIVWQARGTDSRQPVAVLPEDATLLVQVRDDWLQAVNNVVMGLGPAAPEAEGLRKSTSYYLPADTVVDLRKGLDETLASTGFRPIADAQNLVIGQTGIAVQGGFVMDRLAFAGLVDAVGGVPVTLTAPLVVRDEYGNVLKVIPVGQRLLNGPDAATYVLYLRPGSDESERVARFELVWQSLLAQLPDNPERMRAILGNLGALARSTQPTAELAEFLTESGEAVRSGQVISEVAITTPGALGPLPLQWLNPGESAAQVNRLFPANLIDNDPKFTRIRLYIGAVGFIQAENTLGTLRNDTTFVAWSGRAAGTWLPTSPNEVWLANETLTPAGNTIASQLGSATATTVGVDPLKTPGVPISVINNLPLTAQVTTPSPVVPSSS